MKIYTYDNKVMTLGGKWMEQPAQPGPGPGPTLPYHTLRLKFTEGVTPSFYGGSASQVSISPNIWDWYYVGTNWYVMLNTQEELLEVMGAGDTSDVTSFYATFQNCSKLSSVCMMDTSGSTNFRDMFKQCSSLTSLPQFDTSNGTKFYNMCYGCSILNSVPQFDLSSATDTRFMFEGCYNVESGALDLYQSVSSQAVPPSNHWNMFKNCGSNTVTGAAELAQIPVGWGGTMAE